MITAQSDIFSIGLGLQEPRYIKETGIIEGVMTIKIDFRKGAKFLDGDKEYTAYRTTVNKVKHLFMRQYETILEIRMPEIKTDEGKIKLIFPGIMDKGSGFTYMFEAMVLELSKVMSISDVAKHCKEHHNTIMRIVKKYVDKSESEADYSNVKNVCIDETASKRGHNYITTMVNADTKKVCGIVTGKGAETIENLAKNIEAHNGKRENIEQACIDLSPSFISGCKTSLPTTEVVFDRFHIMQFVHKALDEIRRMEAIKNKQLLHKSRYIWLSSSEKLNNKNQTRLDEMMKQNSNLALAYQMKENLKDFFSKETQEEAEAYLNTWCEMAMNSGLQPFIEVVKTIKRHWIGILLYIKNHLTNGLMEGLNGIIQAIKGRARGYRNMQNFMTMIYLKLGDFPILLPT